ncbi:MAG: nucleotidyltransferase family protein [Candidatus Micrarchaeota archaeon]
MKAFILCGGKGTRLRPYTHSVPKPMLLLGRKPILEYTIDHFKNQGFRDIVLGVGHLHKQIMDYFGDGKKFGVNISYSIEETELGDAGGINHAAKLLKNDKTFVMETGDHLTNLDYRRLVAFHEKHGKICTAALKRTGTPMQFGLAEINDKAEITEFKEKPIIESLINAHIYAFDKRIFDYLPEKGGISFDVLPKLLAKKQLAGFVFDDYWIDVGNIKDYEELSQTVSLMDLISQVNGKQ